MTNEEFQKIVLEELRNLKVGQNEIKEEQSQMREEQSQMREEQQQMKEEQGQMKEDIKAIIEQTADLTEFREETNYKLDLIIEENDILKELIGKHEVDIRRLQRRIV